MIYLRHRENEGEIGKISKWNKEGMSAAAGTFE
jgi:hypothetical protein